jgi:hypothetical protein
MRICVDAWARAGRATAAMAVAAAPAMSCLRVVMAIALSQ